MVFKKDKEFNQMINIKLKLSKKVIILLIIVGCFTLAGTYLLLITNQPTNDDYYFIGVAGTFEDKSTNKKNDMLQGLELAAARVNQSGGIDGKTIKLVVQNDKNDPSIAMKVASNFSQDKRILLVLGHYYSTPSLVGADIYQKNAIPAITASATYDPITHDNEWYFRTIPNNSYYAEFMGTYLGLNLRQWPVVIISGEDDFHQNITNDFIKTIQKYGINLIEQFYYNIGERDVSPQLIKISNTIKRINKKSIIFISANTKELIELVRLLKSSPKKYHFKIFGTDSAATSQFITGLSTFPREQNKPGFYSDGIVTLSASIPGTGNQQSFQFYQDFYETYHKDPSWVAASYYDTLILCSQAIKRSEIVDNAGIREKRKKIRNALNEFYDHKHAFNGVTGNIFFDDNGDAKRPLIPAHYQNNLLIPEYIQYQRKFNQNLDHQAIDQSLNNDIVVIDNTVLNKKKLVFANIQILSIKPYKENNQIFSTVDFYLKFEFSETFEDNNICFVKAKEPVFIGKPVMESKEKGVTQRLYRIKADFKHKIDNQSFLLDRHEISIRFHHKSKTADYLTYVPSLTLKDVTLFDDWTIASHHSSICRVENENIPKLKVIKDNLYYSQVNTGIILSKKMNGIRWIVPFFVMVILLYGVFFISIDRMSTILYVVCTAIIINTYYYYKIIPLVNHSYLIKAEMVCLLIYALSILVFILNACVSMFHVKKQVHKERMIRYIGIVIFPVLIVIFLMIVF
ncbi:MAG: branched chain amino acid ABC transporter substrate-binding protein [Candidatus Magnetoglobus multicellularis str. Araruama]|uniref:Branched chain amino acid ABC transporter substrate-binding protein n=1 Tax=Candidatus Magnetoglobus multicellularis str. Araruama TaxID=890399 RepID=A0A1V1PAN8_9BACT|nr:MAG: branched chain amino acid ABC transporter substrate-binding protein [Candidatus Magnetoglobus multicellularis str. Araruama]